MLGGLQSTDTTRLTDSTRKDVRRFRSARSKRLVLSPYKCAETRPLDWRPDWADGAIRSGRPRQQPPSCAPLSAPPDLLVQRGGNHAHESLGGTEGLLKLLRERNVLRPLPKYIGLEKPCQHFVDRNRRPKATKLTLKQQVMNSLANHCRFCCRDQLIKFSYTT